MRYKKILYTGIIIFLLSIIVGTSGIIWGISGSFDALRTNETAGIEQVGYGIRKALIFNVSALVGACFGLILIVIGVLKSKKKTN